MNSKEAKINRGTLVEIPQISIDGFGSLHPSNVDWNTSRAFFLTHYDDEICSDVLSSKFLNTISDPDSECCLYLHELAFHYLKYWTTTDYIENGDEISLRLDKLKNTGRILFLETNHRIRLHFQTFGQEDRVVDVTAISSGSNIGCIMLLFADFLYTKRILYTGNCRLTLKDLQQCPVLHYPNGDIKELTKLYLDTTYCIEDAKELPARNQVTEKLLDSLFTDENSRNYFDFSVPLKKVYHLGFLQRLAERIEGGLHVPLNMVWFLAHVPQFEGIIHWEAHKRDRVHFDCTGDSCDTGYCRKRPVARRIYYGSEGNDSDENLFDNEYCLERQNWGVKLDVLTVEVDCNLTYHDDDPTAWASREDEKQWCTLSRDPKMVYNISKDNLRGIYSSNLSRFEMGRFINYFNMDLNDVVPLYKSPKMQDNEFLILLEMGCADAPDEPKYLQQELPSYSYDFTSIVKNPTLNSSEVRKDGEELSEYLHIIKDISYQNK